MKKNLFLTTIASMALATMMAQSVPSYVPLNGLKGYWGFDGDANDYSVNGNNGTVYGATLTTDRFGNANKAYSFNGSSNYISIPNITSLDGSTGLTISVWAKITGLNTNTNCSLGCVQFLVSRGSDQGSGHFHIALYENVGNQKFNGALNNNGCSNCSVTSKLQYPIPQAYWYNVVTTYDGTNIKLYINGILDTSITYSTPIGSSTNPIFFGKHLVTNYPYFVNGKLDDIGIWNRALSNNEIKQLYIGGCTSPPSPTIIASGNTTFCQGDSVTLFNSSVYSLFQWKKSNSNIAGAIENNYAAKNSGTYKCVITNGCGTVTSNIISVTKNPIASVSISGAPLDFCIGGSVTLTATNPGAGYTYQWFKNNLSIPGATTLTYVANSSGTYKIAITNQVNGCIRTSGTKKVTVTICKNGVPQSEQDLIQSSINVYPNPVSNSFTFELNEDVKGIATISLLNTLGQTLFENKSEVENGQPIETIYINDKLKAGLYILRIEVGDKMYVSKVVVN